MRDTSNIDPQTRMALAEFRTLLLKRYGTRLRGLVLFGSRARGDHRPDSDADVAVFIGDAEDPVSEQMDIADEAYQVFLRDGLLIQPWVFRGSPEHPDITHAGKFLRAVQEEGVRV